MRKKVLEYINLNNMINIGDKILVAVSGGPDSICLLNILNSLKDELHITLFAAHINHCLRGEEANFDQQYVEDFCNSIGVKCYSQKVDVASLAKKRKISTELAGREIRYEFFETIFDKENINKIAIAHNANDQAETLLMRIMRGTGIEGLIGIKPIRDDKFIRPILCLNRDEIEEYCDLHNLKPRIDKSNFENIYSRNKVRLDMIPYIKKNFNEEIVTALNRLSELAKIDNEYIETSAEKAYKKNCLEKNNKVFISKEVFKEQYAIKSRILRRAFQFLSQNKYNFEMKHLNEILILQQGATGKEINLPNKIKAKNTYGDIEIYLCLDKKDKKVIDEFFISMKDLKDGINNFNLIDKIGYNLEIEIVNNKPNVFNNNFLIKYFDCDNIKEGIIIRTRKDGDKIIPLGMNGFKKLKSIFIDKKIPKEKRDSIPVICLDNQIAWILGIKTSEVFKVKKDTKNILKIGFTERKY